MTRPGWQQGNSYLAVDLNVQGAGIKRSGQLTNVASDDKQHMQRSNSCCNARTAADTLLQNNPRRPSLQGSSSLGLPCMQALPSAPGTCKLATANTTTTTTASTAAAQPVDMAQAAVNCCILQQHSATPGEWDPFHSLAQRTEVQYISSTQPHPNHSLELPLGTTHEPREPSSMQVQNPAACQLNVQHTPAGVSSSSSSQVSCMTSSRSGSLTSRSSSASATASAMVAMEISLGQQLCHSLLRPAGPQQCGGVTVRGTAHSRGPLLPSTGRQLQHAEGHVSTPEEHTQQQMHMHMQPAQLTGKTLSQALAVELPDAGHRVVDSGAHPTSATAECYHPCSMLSISKAPVGSAAASKRCSHVSAPRSPDKLRRFVRSASLQHASSASGSGASHISQQASQLDHSRQHWPACLEQLAAHVGSPKRQASVGAAAAAAAAQREHNHSANEMGVSSMQYTSQTQHHPHPSSRMVLGQHTSKVPCDNRHNSSPAKARPGHLTEAAAPAADPHSPDVCKARQRLLAFRQAQESQAARVAAEEGAARAARMEAAQQAAAEKERRRINLYAMNAVLRMCDEAQAASWKLELSQRSVDPAVDVADTLEPVSRSSSAASSTRQKLLPAQHAV